MENIDKLKDSQRLILGGFNKDWLIEPIAPVPLYQALNEYFVEIFKEHPLLDQVIIADEIILQNDLVARFKISYGLDELSHKLKMDAEYIPEKGYVYKRADFYFGEEEQS